MPRITATLLTAEDSETGLTGLIVKGLPRPMNGTTNTATEGLLIAHDLIEHVNGVQHIGTINDELEALGAMWYVRGQHGDLHRNRLAAEYSVEDNIAADVVQMFTDHIFGSPVDYYGRVGRDCERQHTRACNADEALRLIMRIAADEQRRELGSYAAQAKAGAMWPAYAALCLDLMRTGYRKAYRRWERHGRFAANNAFWEIAYAVDPYAKHCEYVGQRFQLTYDSRAENGERATCVALDW
jgi:hypothetical protein